MTLRPPWVTWTALVLVVVGAVALLVSHHDRSGAEPHRVPVVLQGAPIMAQAVAEKLDALPGHPLDALVVGEDADPREEVRAGRAVAAVVMDLRRPANVLYVSATNDPDMDRLAATLADRVAAPMGRSSVTERVPPATTPTSRGRRSPWVSGLWVALGFLPGVAWALVGVRRRHDRDFAPGLRSHLRLAATCVGLSAARRAGRRPRRWGPVPGLVGAGAVATYAAALAAVALEVVLGLVGIVARRLLLPVPGGSAALGS